VDNPSRFPRCRPPSIPIIVQPEGEKARHDCPDMPRCLVAVCTPRCKAHDGINCGGYVMDAFKALELIEQMEVNLGDMYAKLQTKFSGDKELESLFYQLHLEELTHVNLAQMQKRIVRAKPADFGEVQLNFTDFNKVMYLVSMVLAMPREKSNEILVQCYVIESSLVEQYVVAALKDTNREMRQLLEMLSQGFRDHLATLAVRVKDLGFDITHLNSVRFSPRISFSGRVSINEKFYARCVDISESGMFLLTAQTFPEGTTIALSFPIGNGMVATQAVVRYPVPNAGIGLLFQDLPEKDRTLIREYVDEELQKLSDYSQHKLNNRDEKGVGTA
jgi:PilZ domain